MKKGFLLLMVLCLVTTLLLGSTSVMAEESFYGDVDGNGKVNNKDLGMFQQYLADWGVSIDTSVADVNDDGRINNKDLGLLQQYLADWDVTLGPDEPEVPEDDDNYFNDTTLDWT